MSPELRRRLAGTGVGLAALAVAGVAGCGGPEPMRIGVVVDCMGVQRPLKAAEESGAQLPLLERGGSRDGDRLATVTVADRPVELVPACIESLGFSMLTRELRRLAEDEDVDAIVAAATGLDEIVLRDVARAHPDVSFVALAHGPREVTLQDPAPNLYRFEADYGQGVSGLAEYAYDTLGWRSVAIVDAAWVIGWAHRDAFAAEFCALGGRVTDQIGIPVLDPAGRDAGRVPIDADGVAVFTARFAEPERFLRRLSARLGEPAQRMVVGPSVIDDLQLLAAMRRPLDGVVGASHYDPQRVQAFMERHHRHFPGMPAVVAADEVVTGYRDAVEALLQALEHADGDPRRLPAALADLRIELLGGTVRLDEHRQAVASTSLVRVDGTRSSAPPVERIAVRDGVDQSLGGLLPDDARTGNRPGGCT
ncbi:MAG TPA: ABC transporter substrate-binding protein [Solirubrobacteraceae bacterium]|jgi:ABC-type branched-subunit amino acid transport system substrate-binding protein|nr:ABC transporter substrate-binding protein [Solirubrobacteraceae bacterium]